MGGPMWLGPIQDSEFCDEILETLDSGKHTFGTEARIRGMVSTARDVRTYPLTQELDAPFYFHPAKVAGLFHCTSPPLAPVVYVYHPNADMPF